ncbi:MAG: hypothetical protein P4M07_09525 [Xanthobacteraceae bacterium]|nr:hypothetical protein [Xanthobacteraceae bacterium]
MTPASRRFRTLALALALNGLALGGWLAPARADDVVYPKGVRVGLVPLEGLTPASAYSGFEATDQRVKVIVAELPKDAFAAVEAAIKSNSAAGGHAAIEPFELESGAKAYITRETATDNGTGVRRFSLLVGAADFCGYVAVQVPDEAGPGYSDQAVRKMLATITLRASVPPEEQLDRLPFKLADTAGFKSIRALAGGTVLLTDATDEEGLATAPYVLIGVMPDGPATPDDRDRFAQEIARTLPGLRDVRIMSSEPMRLEGMAGFETRLEAVTGKSNTPVRLVQWLRFGNTGATLRIVAGAPRDAWQPAFVRFRAVRDGIRPR